MDGIPVAKMLEEERARLINLNEMSARVVGQTNAIRWWLMPFDDPEQV